MHTTKKMLLTPVLLGILITLLHDRPVYCQSDFFELSKLGDEVGNSPVTMQNGNPFGQSLWTAEQFEGIRLAQANGDSESDDPPAATDDSSDDPFADSGPYGEETFDDFFSVNTFTFNHPWVYGEVEFPVPGRASVADNNLALPQDRFFFLSNQFNNALNDSVAGIGAAGLNQRDRSVGRYSVVVEKTFLNEWMSVELRLPTYGAANRVDAGLTANAVGVGNLGVITKFVVYRSEVLALTLGLGLTAPTGDDTEFSVADQVYTVENQAVHLLPYMAYLFNPTERTFIQGFFQLDTPTTGNQIKYRDVYSYYQSCLGRLNDQTLAYVDLTMGYWLYRNELSPVVTQVATLLELHYSGTLQDADRVYADVWDDKGHSTVEVGNTRNHFNVVNATFGLHTEFRNRIAFRVGGVLPLSTGDDRFFDSEIHSSVIYRF